MTYGTRYIKKERPYGLYAALLILLLVFSYFVSGLFLLEGVTIVNFIEKLPETFLHPFSNWNEKTPACLATAFLIWVMLMGYISTRMRDFHSSMEQGDADWLDPVEADKYLRDRSEGGKNRILSQNVQISLTGNFISNNNMILIGSSGCGKTTGVLHQNILQGHNTYVMLDVKGDTQNKFGNAMKKMGYKIYSLNFKNPEISDRYNPFIYIETEDDMLRSIKAIHDACRPNQENSSADPFWDDAVNLYLQALFYAAWLEARDNGRPGTMNRVLEFVRMESQKTEELDEQQQPKSELHVYMEKLREEKKNPAYPPVRDYFKLKDGAPDTVRSVILMINSMLAICETAEVRRIFEADDIPIRKLGLEKSMLFLVMPDNNNTYTWIISLFYTQMFDVLIRLSDDELKKPLPVPVEVWLDEFYAGARPADPDKLLGVVRSRNISMIPILQSKAQLEVLFPQEKWGTLFDNCATVLFLGSGPMSNTTHKYISESLGKATADKMTDNLSGGNHGSAGLNFDRIGIDLMTPDQVKRIPNTECIIFLEGHPPIYDQKALPFDMPARNYRAPAWLKKRYDEAQSLGLYRHPVKTLYDPQNFRYVTLDRTLPLQFLDLNDEKNMEIKRQLDQIVEKMPSVRKITVDGDTILYMSCGRERTAEEIEVLYRSALAKVDERKRRLKSLAVLQDIDIPESCTAEDRYQDLMRKPLTEILKTHWEELPDGLQEEICIMLADAQNAGEVDDIMRLSPEDIREIAEKNRESAKSA